ncbi:hypothetical protein MnTg03_00140 [bacterium MnTg03]|nr:hypothetical protein MnTg03_00140 [bacterium MnTg03]
MQDESDGRNYRELDQCSQADQTGQSKGITQSQAKGCTKGAAEHRNRYHQTGNQGRGISRS